MSDDTGDQEVDRVEECGHESRLAFSPSNIVCAVTISCIFFSLNLGGAIQNEGLGWIL